MLVQDCLCLFGDRVVRCALIGVVLLWLDVLTDRGLRILWLCLSLSCTYMTISGWWREYAATGFASRPKYSGQTEGISYELPLDFAGTYSTGVCRIDSDMKPYQAHFVDERWIIWVDNEHLMVMEDKENGLTGCVYHLGHRRSLRLSYTGK